jgi:hypothetical protein
MNENSLLDGVSGVYVPFRHDADICTPHPGESAVGA